MCRALLDQAPTGYVPPSSEKLRTTLLVKAKDAAHHPLINFMVSSLNGSICLKAVDALGKYKDAQYMGELFIKVIEDVDVDSCVQIITDHAPVCKVVGMIVQAKYPQIFWMPCIVHSLNLALKSIALNVMWMESLIEDARHIRNFVQKPYQCPHNI
jgi:hypothetical protein